MTAFIRVKLARTIHNNHRNHHYSSTLLCCLSLLLTSPTLAFTTAPLHRHTSIMSSSTSSGDATFTNKSTSNNIPTYDGDSSAKATDFANYFCAYSQLYHQKQMLTLCSLTFLEWQHYVLICKSNKTLYYVAMVSFKSN